MLNFICKWKEQHPTIYEFIMFNLLANIATLVNFLVLMVGNHIIFHGFSRISFVFGPFDYSIKNGGLCGFLSFLTSYACAQTVNFFVQRKAVFHARGKLKVRSVLIYIVMILIVYFICLYVPTLILEPFTHFFGVLAIYFVNIINILIQIIILYPTMKYLL